MELKYRKQILNGKTPNLPGFKNGLVQMDLKPIQGVSVVPEGLGILDVQRLGAQSPEEIARFKSAHGTYTPPNKTLEAFKTAGSKLLGNAPQIIQSGFGFAQALNQADTNNITSQDVINSAQTTQGDVGGFGYDIKTANSQPLIQQASAQRKQGTMSGLTAGAGLGGSIGSAFGPVGGAIGAVAGGLFGGILGDSAGKDAEEKARQQILEGERFLQGSNLMAKNDARTKYLQTDWMKKYGDTSNQLMMARDGKSPNVLGQAFKYAKNVYTSRGIMPEGIADAKVAKGEGIVDNIDDPDNIQAFRVKNGKLGKDTKYAQLSPSTIVFGEHFQDAARPFVDAIETINKRSNKVNLRGKLGIATDKLVKKQSAAALQDLAAQQEQYHLEKETNQYTINRAKNGKDRLPGFVDGIPTIGAWTNIIPSALGMLSSIQQYNDAKNQTPYRPNIYAENPYEREALNTALGLRINPHPILSQILADERQALFRNNASGGLRGPQKYLANIATSLGSQRTRANALAGIQEKNNSYFENYAKMAMEAGIGNANRKMEANKYAEDYYAKSHAARQSGMQMGLRNFMDYLTQFGTNETTRQLYNGQLGIWQQQANSEKDYYDYLTNGEKKPITVDPYFLGQDQKKSAELDNRIAPQFKLRNPFNYVPQLQPNFDAWSAGVKGRFGLY